MIKIGNSTIKKLQLLDEDIDSNQKILESYGTVIKEYKNPNPQQYMLEVHNMSVKAWEYQSM